ncbi:mitochondrial ribosome-associated GTPase 2-like [Watersipora subatra]|uniref:mitochondrial ribosome-associated GTPase 2-like n=1 Tax=Watersipora subatra TaxID=2589382 RepID=UPI00355BDD6A
MKLYRIFNQVHQQSVCCCRSALMIQCSGYSANRRTKPRIVYPRERVSEKKLSRRFVDYLLVTVKGGDGGNGMIGFSSLPCKEWAGPDGGDGGNGGHVIITACHNVNSFSHVASVLVGKHGTKGRAKCQHGRNAEHTNVRVPVGTLVKNADTKQLLADLSQEGKSYILGRGGAGGHGNHFYLSNEMRAPAIAEEGGKGEHRQVILELKVSAHVGLVGFPNAGKSTLLTALSRATPAIADYPFTTLNPHIGMVQYRDNIQVAVADIPGLIEGSHMDRGLGISFLRHIEKCACLLYVLDLSAPEPWQQLEQLQYELEQYMKYLSKRPHAIIANKIDLPGMADKLEILKSKVSFPVIEVSGKEGHNMEALRKEILRLYEAYGQAAKG